MESINLKEIFDAHLPGYFDKYPKFISRLVLNLLERILMIPEINQFLARGKDKHGFEFIDELFDYLDFSYLISSQDQLKIPSEGKTIIVANHPLGALDGLALLRAVATVRQDVKIVANDILMHVDNLSDHFLPFNVFSTRPQRKHIEGIRQSILNDEAIIFFPAAEVSRLSLKGIRDRAWLNGPLYFARKFQTPVLPIYIKARNTYLFYYASLLHKRFSMFLLAREIDKKRNKSITLRVGDPIPSEHFTSSVINTKYQSRLLKRHVYRLGKKKPGIFKTVKTIIHPVDTKIIKNELAHAQLLTTTSDGKSLYLVEFDRSPNVVKEISRLREVTFRKVGEGTGAKTDFDRYDKYYKHIVLWDDDSLDIVGSYRLGLSKDIIDEYGVDGLYNASLFNFSDRFMPYLEQSLELGRSFVQQKYWRSNALDQLWQGLAAFVAQKPQIKYLFGAVSISDNYSSVAKNMIVYFYNKWFGDKENLVTAKYRYVLSRQQEKEMSQILNSEEYENDFINLKSTLKNLGFTIPILFRRYSELCEKDGVKFLDFDVDKDFSNCVDGLVILTLDKLKPSKRKRYFGG
ncbi:MAG: GNAT family N-acyltransferase [candidate division KSB1 bacterium]|jgi:putative hemolysin|nr:GNAT family N-acyltransferase [candidate division KSB1 bacterium]